MLEIAWHYPWRYRQIFGIIRNHEENKVSLFWRILIAIAVGVGLGYAAMHAGEAGMVGVRVFKTFNLLFSQILKFIVPLLILGLVTPAIANAGRGAGRMLVFVMLFSYLSTCTASLFAYFSAGQLLPLYVAKGAVASAGEGLKILPYLDLKIPPVCDVLTALALSFMVGIGIVATNAVRMKAAADEFAKIVTLTIQRVIIPGLPVYIMTMICEMTFSVKIGAMAFTMAKVVRDVCLADPRVGAARASVTKAGAVANLASATAVLGDF